MMLASTGIVYWVALNQMSLNLITSRCFELCDIQRFHCQKVCANEGPILYPYKTEEICMALFHIRTFLQLHYNLCFFSMWLTRA